LACDGADGGDGWHSTLESGRKWPELLHMAKKHLKKHRKYGKKQIEGEWEIWKGERRLLPPLKIKWFLVLLI
jgi:hypothetical protein